MYIVICLCVNNKRFDDISILIVYNCMVIQSAVMLTGNFDVHC